MAPLRQSYFPLAFPLAFVILASCTHVQQEDGAWVSATIEEKTGHEVKWLKGDQEDARVQEKIDELLTRDLLVEEAVQIALLNNPSLQATYEEIGIALADLVEAGLFTNPFFEGYARWPNVRTASFNAAFSLATTFIDLFLIPLRKKTAELQFEQSRMNVANAVLHLVSEVERIFYALQAAMTKADLQRSLIEVASVAEDLAQGQLEAGNVNCLFYEIKLSDKQQTELVVEQTELEIITLREKLKILMGIKGEGWKIDTRIFDLPGCEVCLDELNAIALQERLDVEAARKEVDVIASIGAQKKWWSYTNGQIGVSWEQEADHIREFGPAFGLAIPIFNYGQADRARLFAQLRQAQAKLTALEIEVLAQVKAAQDRLIKTRRIAEYYINSLLPIREKIIQTAIGQANVMAYGVYDLLAQKRSEVESLIYYEMALCDYWSARAVLDLVVGKKLRVENE